MKIIKGMAFLLQFWLLMGWRNFIQVTMFLIGLYTTVGWIGILIGTIIRHYYIVTPR
jgi:hypothetical protein